MSRSDQIIQFLKKTGIKDAKISPLAGDASFRRYDRVEHDGNIKVLMDAPPEFEDTRPFYAIADFLSCSDLNSPKIYAKDFENGFLLLEDLGAGLFKTVLEQHPERELELYRNAVDELVTLNACDVPPKLSYGEGDYELSHYDMNMLLTEISLFTDWYYPALTGHRLCVDKRKVFLNLWYSVLKDVSTAKECLVLRDYHAENLVDLGNGNVGQLDFQDAVIGHSAYDLVSLLQDSRRDASVETEEKLIKYFTEKLGRDESRFRADYAVLGAQRSVKIIGIFARLCLRDSKRQYLNLIPRMWGLLERCIEHPLLIDIKNWLDLETPDKRDIALDAIALVPNHAMILAAGLGTRMKPLTDNTPKPLLKVAGKAMLDHTLDALAAAGVANAVINKHHHADQIDAFVDNRKDWRPNIILSNECDELLDSGGGVKKALPMLGGEPFYILNSDMIWTDNGQLALSRLATFWRDDMDILMLLIKRDEARGHDGVGDFHLNENGSLRWRGDDAFSDYHYGGVLIIRPECFENTPDGPFTLRKIFRKSQKEGRLFGLPHDGVWYHVGTISSLKDTEQHLKGK